MNEREENQEGGAGSRVPRDLEQGLAAGLGRAAPRDVPGPAASVLDRLASSAGVRARISLREEPSRKPAPLLTPRGPGPGVGGWPAVEGKYQVQG
jgi:hypothetical protein